MSWRIFLFHFPFLNRFFFSIQISPSSEIPSGTGQVTRGQVGSLANPIS